jgi:hypothetical protein
MFSKTVAIISCFISFSVFGQDCPAFGPPGYELPDRVTPENLVELSDRMRRNACKTSGCEALSVAIGEVLTDTSQRHQAGTIWLGNAQDIPYGALKAREIEDSLKGIKAMWPGICRAVVEIGARDDFVHGNETYSWIAGASLDMSRHLTRPGLDCLGQALAVMPESKHKQRSMRDAWVYCLDERRGAARCARLKPSDPEFLPVPEHSVH